MNYLGIDKIQTFDTVSNYTIRDRIKKLNKARQILSQNLNIFSNVCCECALIFNKFAEIIKRNNNI